MIDTALQAPNRRLYKKEKLCSATAINALFSRDAANFTVSAYPLRAFWRVNPGRKSPAPAQFLVSVPKKRLRHAVDRVKMRRRIREAYRLLREGHPIPQGVKVDIVFVYVASDLHPYAHVERAMCKMLDAISHHPYEDTPAAR